MKKKLSLVLALFGALVVTVVVLAGCSSSSTESTDTSSDSADASSTAASDATYTLVEDGTLTCVAELGFAPFEYMEEGSTEPVGFDIDVAKAIAEKLELKCVFLPNQAFDTLIPTIKEGAKADIAISGITITDERKQEIDFTDPYFDSNQALIVKKDSKATPESLNAEGVKVACQSGTTGDAWIKENLPDAERVPLADVSAGEAGVSTGLYDAYVIDLPVATQDIKNSFSDLKVLEEIPTGEQLGIAVSKDNPALTAAINDALAQLEADGTLASLKAKWMPTSA